MIVGITGTRHGMTERQLRDLRTLITPWFGQVQEFHHGACVGADEEAHRIVVGHTKVVVHPPLNPVRMMNLDQVARGVHVLPPKGYDQRNRDIVDACDLLLVAPFELQEQERGGTWNTYRYARDKKRRACLLIWP